MKAGGGPFTAWATVFERTSDRIRARFEPRFPHVTPAPAATHLRDADPGIPGVRAITGRPPSWSTPPTRTRRLALYLAKADPLMVLRDLLGHSSVPTTEEYLRRLDTTRIYPDAYERAGPEPG